MSENHRARRVAEEVAAIRAEYAEEESEAAEAEVAERRTVLDVPLNLRIDTELDAELRKRAAEAQIPVSALVRRLLRDRVTQPAAETLTVEQVEQIARRILHEAN